MADTTNCVFCANPAEQLRCTSDCAICENITALVRKGIEVHDAIAELDFAELKKKIMAELEKTVADWDKEKEAAKQTANELKELQDAYGVLVQTADQDVELELRKLQEKYEEVCKSNEELEMYLKDFIAGEEETEELEKKLRDLEFEEEKAQDAGTQSEE